MSQQPSPDAIVFRQATAKLLRMLPLAFAMAGGSAAIGAAGLQGAGVGALLAGGLGLSFFGPALVILLWALVRPNYLAVDADALRFRLYSLEADIPWGEIRRATAGAGWPALTFYDCDQASHHVRFRGLKPLGWALEVPTQVAGLIIRQPIANIYPSTRRQLVSGFHANERMFGFHCGLPTSLLEGSTKEMVAAMRRRLRR
jgi:hypothetical protein